jgi:large subunit ribosomal protein L31e
LSQELERVYTINLGKVWLSVDTHRATRAINMIKEFARRHMKVEDIKIEEDLAQQIWARGARSPPRKIRVRMTKTDEGYILVSRFDDEVEAEVTPDKETKKIEETVEPTKEESSEDSKKMEETVDTSKETPSKKKHHLKKHHLKKHHLKKHHLKKHHLKKHHLKKHHLKKQRKNNC